MIAPIPLLVYPRERVDAPYTSRTRRPVRDFRRDGRVIRGGVEGGGKAVKA
ncbi:MAG: hypothetical protein ACJ74T_21640 [Pyrinomonadaceae bacterium]